MIGETLLYIILLGIVAFLQFTGPYPTVYLGAFVARVVSH